MKNVYIMLCINYKTVPKYLLSFVKLVVLRVSLFDIDIYTILSKILSLPLHAHELLMAS